MSELPIVRRVLGVDFGRARIGVAVSDELGLLAHPVETIPGAQVEAAAKRVAEIAREKNVERVVLGMPRHMNGRIGRGGRRSDQSSPRNCARSSAAKCVMWDERLTTMAANRALRDAGQKTRRTRGFVDQVAAQMILQGYLDQRAELRAIAVEATTLHRSGVDAAPAAI